MKKRRRKKNRRLLWFILALGLLVYISLALRDLAPTPPYFDQYRLFTVQSGSMAPALQTHSLIVVKRTDQVLPTLGEMITFRSPQDSSRLITHRVTHVGFDGDFYYLTKGDANRDPDPYFVRPADVYGRVVYVSSPGFAGIVRFLRSDKAAYPLFLILFFLLLTLLKDYSRRPSRSN